MAKSWSAMAREDLAAMHDLIRDNHPGVVNADDPEFSIWLEQGLEAISADALAAQSEYHYRLALCTYCAFRRSQPPIPTQTSHLFRSKPAGYSDASQPG